MNDKLFTELLPNLHFVSGEQGGRFPFSHGLMLNNGRKVLIDAGFGQSRREAILAGGEVDIIINTHFHLDHAYGNQFFPNAQIWVHRLDAPALRSPENFLTYTGLGVSDNYPFALEFPGGPPAQEVERELSDGDVLVFEDLSLQVIHTPGHTPGHIALYEAETGLLFAGDIDLSPFGPWYGNLRSDLEEFANSVKRLIDLNPKVLVTSHAGIVADNIQERLRGYLDKFELRDQQILQALQAAKTLPELVDLKILYRRYPEPQELYRFFEEIMLKKHLQRLVRQGKIYINPSLKYQACD